MDREHVNLCLIQHSISTNGYVRYRRHNGPSTAQGYASIPIRHLLVGQAAEDLLVQSTAVRPTGIGWLSWTSAVSPSSGANEADHVAHQTHCLSTYLPP